MALRVSKGCKVSKETKDFLVEMVQPALKVSEDSKVVMDLKAHLGQQVMMAKVFRVKEVFKATEDSKGNQSLDHPA